MAYSALFNNVFEALNLLFIIFYAYVAEIQLPSKAFGSSPLWLAIGDFHHIM
jgi:hypothetical protein